MNYEEIFNKMHPNFFQEEGIRKLPKDWIFTELVLDLRENHPNATPSPCPKGITFGEFHGELASLHDAVLQVDEDWVQYFTKEDRFFCAFEGEMIVAFCILSDMGKINGLRIGGPGCVGTIPEFRRKGIGIEMVRQATEILIEDGFDLSWIHYTHLDHWYMKLGYKPVVRWNCCGIINDKTESGM